MDDGFGPYKQVLGGLDMCPDTAERERKIKRKQDEGREREKEKKRESASESGSEMKGERE
jgi:hypothetical protein